MSRPVSDSEWTAILEAMRRPAYTPKRRACISPSKVLAYVVIWSVSLVMVAAGMRTLWDLLVWIWRALSWS
jgi:hypothetical protein